MTRSDGLFNNKTKRVLKYAEENSGEKAAGRFDIDPRRIRYWKKQKDELTRLADKSRARLASWRWEETS